jgi:Arc/MetJ family transcription regulator
MAKTLIDIDEDLLTEATTALGTSTKKDTVIAALRVVVEEKRARRAQALANLQAMAADGLFDFDQLAALED